MCFFAEKLTISSSNQISNCLNNPNFKKTHGDSPSVSIKNCLTGNVRNKCDRAVLCTVNHSFLFLNIQCLRNKINALELEIQKYSFNSLCLCEHWLNTNEAETVNLGNYVRTEFFARRSHIHGGVIQFIDPAIDYKPLKEIQKKSVEMDSEFCGVFLSNLNICVIVLYRSPLGDINIFFDTLTELLTTIDFKHKNVLIGGDFNVHFDKVENRFVRSLYNLFESFGLRPLVHFPTRNTSYLDNVFSNIPEQNVVVSSLELGLSDHLGIVVNLKNLEQLTSCEYTVMRPITACGKYTFFRLLYDTDWSFLNDSSNANSKFDTFLMHIVKIFNFIFPLKKVKFRKNSPKTNIVWYNNELGRLRDTLQFLSDDVKLHGSLESKKMLQETKKKYYAALKQAKICANDKFIRENKNNPRALWKLIKKYKPDHVNKNCTITPDEFNTFFCSIAENIKTKLPNSKLDPIYIMSSTNNVNCQNYFTFHTVSEVQVRNAIDDLKNSKSADIYGFSVPLIKSVKDILISPLTKLVNYCLNENTFPEALKKASVIPIYKKGDPHDSNNYRPISLLPVFSKIFEKLLLKQIIKFLDDNNILSPNQFGFKKGSSAVTAILKFVENVINSFEQKKIYSTHFLDLSKAFDCVDHDILLRKLFFYNFHPTSTKLISSYLSNRVQYVKCNGKWSEGSCITYGVPQGSILGPILFLLYINDFPSFIPDADIILFADDTAISNSNASVKEVNGQSKILFNKSEEWFSTNKLCLNKDKTINLQFSTVYAENSVNSSHTRYLGLFMDTHLKWNFHEDETAKKISKNTYLIRFMANGLSQQCLRMTYFALIHCHLEYGVLVWGHSKIRHHLFQLQRRVIRIIVNTGYRDDCKDYFIELKILTLPCIFIYRCVEYIISKSDVYSKLNAVHTYNTRTDDYAYKKLRLTRSRDGLNYYCIKFFNAIPTHVRTMESKTFLAKLKSYLLKNAFYSFEEFMNSEFTQME